MSQDQKRDSIIDAAIKRFAHFGVAKTTMSEIAADLSISKALLYYYFPDKLSLFVAVFKKVTELDAKTQESRYHNVKDPLEAIQIYLESRTDLIIKYYNILEYLKSFTQQNIPKELEPVFTALNQRELQQIINIFENANAARFLQLKDVKNTAELYFEFLEGFRYAFFNRRADFFPEKKQFQAILKKEKEFSVIFLKGLANPTK